MIFVINKHADFKAKFGDLIEYVGRPSILGNPFKINKGFGGRDAVVEEFRKYLWNFLKDDLGEDNEYSIHKSSKVFNEIERLARAHSEGRNIYLQCHCAPKNCHAFVIKKAIIWFSENILKK